MYIIINVKIFTFIMGILYSLSLNHNNSLINLTIAMLNSGKILLNILILCICLLTTFLLVLHLH